MRDSLLVPLILGLIALLILLLFPSRNGALSAGGAIVAGMTLLYTLKKRKTHTKQTLLREISNEK